MYPKCKMKSSINHSHSLLKLNSVSHSRNQLPWSRRTPRDCPCTPVNGNGLNWKSITENWRKESLKDNKKLKLRNYKRANMLNRINSINQLVLSTKNNSTTNTAHKSLDCERRNKRRRSKKRKQVKLSMISNHRLLRRRLAFCRRRRREKRRLFNKSCRLQRLRNSLK